MIRKVGIFMLVLAGTANAQMTGDFSRANCVTNNESITFLPFNDGLPRGVVSWHRPSAGFLHYAGDEDPVSCSLAPCPTSPNPLEDAICFTHDACLWALSTSPTVGRWAAIHNLFGLDDDGALHTGPWEVEGRHVTLLGVVFGQPIYTVNTSGPVTDCSL